MERACVSSSSSTWSSGVAVSYVGNSRLPDLSAFSRFVVFIQEFDVDFTVESSLRSQAYQALVSLQVKSEIAFLLHRVLMN